MSRVLKSFPVLTILPTGRIGEEPMGTKEKFWYEGADGQRYLFKYPRPGTGEHWAEKVVAEIATLLHVPCAYVDLATFQGEQGCSVRSFAAAHTMSLVHGNELLQRIDEAYPVTMLRGVAQHTVRAVLGVLQSYSPPSACPIEASMRSAADWFLGYLLLDAMVMNGDRHHENWAVLQGTAGGVGELAPCYDNASSLGRELQDERRLAMLGGKSRGQSVEAYIKRGRSAFYGSEGDAKPLHPAVAYRVAAAERPAAASYWSDRLKQVSFDELGNVLERVPSEFISSPGKAFALALLESTLHEMQRC